jgi:hypothetical protein
MIQLPETPGRREERIERAIRVMKSEISLIRPLSDELYAEIAERFDLI